MTERTHQDVAELAAATPSAAPGRPGLTPAQALVLRAQAGAGNAAVARALLARDAPAGAAPAPTAPPTDAPTVGPAGGSTFSPLATGAGAAPTAGGLPSLVPGLQFTPKPIPPELDPKLRDYLKNWLAAVPLQAEQMTMPVLVNRIRHELPEANEANAFDLSGWVREILQDKSPPEYVDNPSANQDAAQLEALVVNALPKPPTEFKINAGPGTLAFSLSGVEAKSGAVTVKATPGGGDVTVKEGDASVGATGSFKGDAFGIKASVGSAAFDASISKDATSGDWSHWAMNFKFPIVGGQTIEARPPVSEISDSVIKAEGAVSGVISHLRAGGSPTDDVVKNSLGAIKPAISNVSAAVEQRKGPPRASVKISAGGGDPHLGTSVTISLVIEF